MNFVGIVQSFDVSINSKKHFTYFVGLLLILILIVEFVLWYFTKMTKINTVAIFERKIDTVSTVNTIEECFYKGNITKLVNLITNIDFEKITNYEKLRLVFIMYKIPVRKFAKEMLPKEGTEIIERVGNAAILILLNHMYQLDVIPNGEKEMYKILRSDINFNISTWDDLCFKTTLFIDVFVILNLINVKQYNKFLKRFFNLNGEGYFCDFTARYVYHFCFFQNLPLPENYLLLFSGKGNEQWLFSKEMKIQQGEIVPTIGIFKEDNLIRFFPRNIYSSIFVDTSKNVFSDKYGTKFVVSSTNNIEITNTHIVLDNTVLSTCNSKFHVFSSTNVQITFNGGVVYENKKFMMDNCSFEQIEIQIVNTHLFENLYNIKIDGTGNINFDDAEKITVKFTGNLYIW